MSESAAMYIFAIPAIAAATPGGGLIGIMRVRAFT